MSTKKLHPFFLTRLSLDGVAALITWYGTNPQSREGMPIVPDESLVLMDQITDLWPWDLPVDFIHFTQVRASNRSILHRWLLIDAIRSAEMAYCIPKARMWQNALEALKTWVLVPTTSNLAKVAHYDNSRMEANRTQVGSGNIAAVNCVAGTIQHNYEAKFAVTANAWLCSHREDVERQAHQRVRLYGALRDLLPEPVPEVFKSDDAWFAADDLQY